MKTLNAAIIGAGSIGGLIDTPDALNISSHAHGYEKCAFTELKAICEVNEENIKEFKKRWGEVSVYGSVIEMLQNEHIDIVSIATPTFLHKDNLEDIFKSKNGKYILCEKPWVNDAKELEEVKELLVQSDKKIIINLMRRYNKVFAQIKDMRKNKELGEAKSFYGVCTKGILHNGSHLLGVIEHFFDEVKDIKNIDAKSINNDAVGKFSIECSKISGIVDVLQNVEYSIFELKIYFQKGLIHINGSDIEVYESIPSSVYEGYNILEKKQRYENILSAYALDSIEFLITSDEAEEILDQHIRLHEKILKNIGTTL
jgi:predicted dehydrogenase